MNDYLQLAEFIIQSKRPKTIQMTKVIIKWKQDVSTGIINQSEVQSFRTEVQSFNDKAIDLIANGLRSEGAFDLSITIQS